MIEQVYGARNKRLILPQSFRHNLVAYSLSGSKLLLELNNSSMPCGSYTYLKNWLENNAKNEIPFPDVDVRVVFNNEQVVGKRYMVSLDNPKVPISVITSHAYLELNNQLCWQNKREFAPKNWFIDNLNDEKFAEILDVSNKYCEHFRQSRNRLNTPRLNFLTKEQKISDLENNASDYVDELVAQLFKAKTEKTCSICGGANDYKYRSCTNCHGKLENFSVNIDCNSDDKCYDPYGHFDNFSVKKSSHCQNGGTGSSEPKQLC